ncbi:MAG TPA: DMT family transporter [Actinomycetota bacterium]|nr:DMT family transporter [Actinomycetota bacterium]
MRATPVISTARGTRTEAFGPLEWGLLASIALMWGSSFLLIALGLEAFEPGLVAALRLAFGTAAVALAPGSRRRVRREDWPRIAVLGVVWMAIPLALFPIAQQWVASSVAGMINGSMPLFAALFAWWLLGRAPEGRQGAGLLLGFSGVVLIVLPTAQGGSATAVGAGLLLFGTMLYGLAANITVPLQQRYGALPVVLRAQLVALAVLTPYGLLSVPGSTFSWPAAVSMAVLGVFATGVAFIAMVTLVGRAGATRGAVAIYFLPVVAVVLGVTFRGEPVHRLSLIGIALVLGGAYLTSRRERPFEVEPAVPA